MDFTLRVFISSTSVDLLEYRQAADRAIRSLGATSDDMVLWSADERDGTSVSVDRVRQCDAMVLIVAHRYGFVPEGAKYSVTEQEYRAARAAGLPVFAFLLDESVPWPPKFIERERPEELTRFRAAVEREVTRQLFRSPDELSRLITQALVSLVTRRGASRRPQRLAERTLTVVPSIQLTSAPDAVVPLGTAEDDSPLLLRVQRSIEFAPLLDQLARMVQRPGAELPTALFKTFEQSLAQHTRAASAAERVFTVTLRDGTRRNMYVSERTLSQLFRPLLSRILSGAASGPSAAAGRGVESDTARVGAPAGFVPGTGDAGGHATPPAASGASDDVATAVAYADALEAAASETPLPVLQSAGGRNRFLGVSLDDGRVYSVGLQSGAWVEWRPFVCESLAAHFPDAAFTVGLTAGGTTRRIDGVLSEYLEALDRLAREQPLHAGMAALRLRVTLSRVSVAALIANIADRLQRSRAGGATIHGDLKAGNVVLARDGPFLIDSFDLTDGQRSPGWSPNWSAPEQVLGLPVSSATDVYPLGMMLVRLLGGQLLGEVRKFRTAPTIDGRSEFDVFYDPFVHVERGESDAADRAIIRWAALARSCLRFDPDSRCPSAEVFSERLRTLLDEDPLPGTRQLVLERQAWAATLPDGTDRLATVIDDGRSIAGSNAGLTPGLAAGFDAGFVAPPPIAPA